MKKWMGLLFLLVASVALANTPKDYKGKPYKTAQEIPGRVQAAYYDHGGEGVAYHNVDAINHGSGELNHQPGHCEAGVPEEICYFRQDEGVDISYTKQMADFKQPNYFKPDHKQLYIGWEEDGEWTNYTVNVKKPGRYTIVAMYSNKPNSVQFSLNGKPAGDCQLPFDTGHWHIWNKAVCGVIDFPEAGIQLLTLHYGKGNNLAYFDFIPEGESIGASGWGMDGFVTRKGDELIEGGKPFRFAGLDSPNILAHEAQLLSDYSNHFPDAYELNDALATLQQMERG